MRDMNFEINLICDTTIIYKIKYEFFIYNYKNYFKLKSFINVRFVDGRVFCHPQSGFGPPVVVLNAMTTRFTVLCPTMNH